MFLAIDVGNTQTTLGLFDEKGQMLHGWRMSTNSVDTADMLHGRLFTFFMKDGLLLDDISAGGIACVVPAISRAWKRCFEVLLKTAGCNHRFFQYWGTRTHATSGACWC